MNADTGSKKLDVVPKPANCTSFLSKNIKDFIFFTGFVLSWSWCCDKDTV